MEHAICKRMITVVAIMAVLFLSVCQMPGSDAYKVVSAGSNHYTDLLQSGFSVGYYDEGIWIWINTYAPASITISDPAWESLISLNDKNHIIVNHNRTSGAYSFVITATQTTTDSNYVQSQSRTLNFDVQVDRLNFVDWQQRVSETEFETTRTYFEQTDVVINASDSFTVTAQLSIDRMTSLTVIECPAAVDPVLTNGGRLTFSTSGNELGLGTHHFYFEIDYGLYSPFPDLHGQTIYVDFNVTVVPDDPVIVSLPQTDLIEGDYFQYAPASDGRSCHLEWNTAIPLPQGLNIHRTLVGGLIREVVYGTVSEDFQISIKATMVIGQRTEFQNINVNVHPGLSQEFIGDVYVTVGPWESTILASGPANVSIDCDSADISMTYVDDQYFLLNGELPAGEHRITVRAVSDYVRMQYSNQTYTINVLPSLVFVTVPQLNGTGNQTWEYSPSLNDENGMITVLDAPAWASFENGILSGTPPESGEYVFSLRGQRDNPFDEAVQSFILVVEPDADLLPIAAFGYHKNSFDIDFQDRSYGASDWYWDFGDGENSTDRNPRHTYADNGTYSVTLTVKNDYGEDFHTRYILVTIGGEEEVPSVEAITVGPGFDWALLLIVPLAGSVFGYHRTRNPLFMIAAAVVMIVLLADFIIY